MTNAETLCNRFESTVHHLVEITNGPVSDGAYASQGSMDVGIDFAPEGSHVIGFVRILNHDNFGAGDGCDVGPVIPPGGRSGLAVRRIGRLDLFGAGIPV